MCETKIQSLKKSVREIISYLVDSVVDGMGASILLLSFLGMGVFLARYIGSLPIPENIIKLLNISFSVILVAITAIYVQLTWQIVNQTNKNSEITFIEKRLEKLYYPLEDVLQNPVIRNSSGYIFKEIDLNKIDNIIPFQYLASKNIEELLNDFIKTAFAERSGTDNNCVTNLIVTEDIKTKVNDDIENYKTGLKKLIKYRN